MTDQRWIDTAYTLLEMAKRSDPLFWSRDKFDSLSKAWGYALQRANLEPEWLYRGVSRFYEQNTSGDRPLVGHIISAARTEQRLYFDSPAGQAQAQEERRKREDERQKQLEEGTWHPVGTK